MHMSVLVGHTATTERHKQERRGVVPARAMGLGLGLGHSIFQSELASAEWMALGMYDQLVELAGCTL